MEELALNLVEKTLLMKWKKLAQSPLEILAQNNNQTPKFIGCQKLAVGVCQTCRSTARSTANGQESDRWSLRSTARSTQKNNREHCSQFRSTRSADRPSAKLRRARRARRSTRAGRPTSELVDYQGSKSTICSLKTVFLGFKTKSFGS